MRTRGGRHPDDGCTRTEPKAPVAGAKLAVRADLDYVLHFEF